MGAEKIKMLRMMACVALAKLALSGAADPSSSSSSSSTIVDATSENVQPSLGLYSGSLMYGMLIVLLLVVYSWVYGSVGAKFLFWSYFGLVIVLMICLPDRWDFATLQATLYMSVTGTIAYRGFYACFCLQAPSRFEGYRGGGGSRVDY